MDDDCQGNLVCHKSLCTGSNWASYMHGCCGNASDIHCKVFGLWADNCCSSSHYQCDAGEGDCNSNSDCKGNLICSGKACPSSVPTVLFKCCVDPATTNPPCDSLTDWSCCSKNWPCAVGQGDCDKNSQCQGNLVCGSAGTSCPSGAPSGFNCCVDPATTPPPPPPCDVLNNWSCCSSSKPCTIGQGDCDTDSHCQGNLVCGHNTSTDCPSGAPSGFDCCKASSNGYDECSTSNKCSAGEGHCQSHDECQSGLVCGTQNCASNYPSDYNCCMTPSQDYCTASNQCIDGEGDCDSHNECQGNSVCGTGNCGSYWPSGYDCCMTPSMSYCTTSSKCYEGEGDCDSSAECQSGLVCGSLNCGSDWPSGYDCCMQPTLDYCQTNPCKDGEGDCDSDDDCQSGLVCGIDNCGSDWPQGYDCCMTPRMDYCSSSSKCGEGIGHCDSHAECEDGLACGTDNCGSTWPSGYDCCYTPQCHNSESPAWDCCRVDAKCGQGLGDCDSDEECENGLVCKADGCGSDWPEGYDCCVLP